MPSQPTMADSPFRNVVFTLGASRMDGMPQEGLPEIALTGRSNVGKSSLVNAILGRKAMARISGTPGKTREINFYRVEDKFNLVDVPGIGYAKVSQTERARWGKLLERYFRERKDLRLLVHLVDSRHPVTAIDQSFLMESREWPVPVAIALTKTDKISRNLVDKHTVHLQHTLAGMHLEMPIFPVSAHTGRGLEALREWIAHFAGWNLAKS
jgi:GTP-binding protein